MVLIYRGPIEKWKCVFKECSAACCTGGKEVTAGDIERIAKATGLKPEEFANLKDDKGLFKLKNIHGKCYFLNADFGCQLHEKGVKPIFCRMFPFKFDGVIYADEIVLKVRAVEDCPGFGKGSKLGDEFETSIEELGNKFVKEIKEFLRSKREGEA
jgi:Fe-S-cluster containining protein